MHAPSPRQQTATGHHHHVAPTGTPQTPKIVANGGAGNNSIGTHRSPCCTARMSAPTFRRCLLARVQCTHHHHHHHHRHHHDQRPADSTTTTTTTTAQAHYLVRLSNRRTIIIISGLPPSVMFESKEQKGRRACKGELRPAYPTNQPTNQPTNHTRTRSKWAVARTAPMRCSRTRKCPRACPASWRCNRAR